MGRRLSNTSILSNPLTRMACQLKFANSLTCERNSKRSMFQELCQTENRITVVYDPETSHAATHFKDEPSLRELVIEVLEQTVTTDDYMWFETEMGRVVGTTSL